MDRRPSLSVKPTVSSSPLHFARKAAVITKDTQPLSALSPTNTCENDVSRSLFQGYEVYMTYSTVSGEAVRAFASGLRGPCVICMDYDSHGGKFPADDGLTWDHHTVCFENGVRRDLD